MSNKAVMKKSRGVIVVMALVVACGPPLAPQPPQPPPGTDAIEVRPGSIAELTAVEQQVWVPEAATLAVAQGGRVTFELDLHGPELITIPVKKLDDDSGLPQVLYAMRLGTRLGVASTDGQCVRCLAGSSIGLGLFVPDLPCCRPPKKEGGW